jgi:DnaJ-class molecular chaperone
MADSKDYYQLLGISKSANADEIKKAYRKLALQYHPDRNKGKEASEKFKEVNKAYEVLSDSQKRQTYDQFGAAAFEQGGSSASGQSPFGGQSGQYGPFRYSYTTDGSANQGFDFGGFTDPFEIFEQFFGGGLGRTSRRSTYSLTISLDDAFSGTEKKVTINGKSQSIKIPKGVDSNSRIRFGDFDVIIQVATKKGFQREGADIFSEEEVSFSNAALGTEIPVTTLDGSVKLKIPSGTQPNTLMRLRAKGMPFVSSNGRGDQYVRIKVIVPKSLSKRAKDLLLELDLENSKKRWF